MLSSFSPRSVLQNPVTLRQNLVKYPNFEIAPPEAWHTRSGGGTCERQTTTVHDGTTALKVVTPGTEEFDGCENSDSIIPLIQPSTPYVFSCWIKGEAGVEWTCIQQEHTSAGAFVQNKFASLICNGSWQRLSETFMTESTTSKIQLVFYTPALISRTVYIDSLMLEPGSTRRPYFDGSLAPSNYEASWLGTTNAGISQATLKTPTEGTNFDKALYLDAPQAYYRLSEPVGETVVHDSSINDIDGLYKGSPTLEVEGWKASSGTGFTAAEGKYASIPENPSLDGADNWTVEIVFKLNGNNSHNVLLSKGSGSYSIRIGEDNATIEVLKENNYNLAYFSKNSNSTKLNTEWHHLLIYKNGTSMGAWIDGVFDSGLVSEGVKKGERPTVSTTVPLTIGRSTDNTGEWADATIDAVAVYSGTLSESRIKAHYEAIVGGEKHEYSVGVSETLSPSQTIARVVTNSRGVAETLTPSQAVARSTAIKRVPTETLSPSQAPTRTVGFQRKVEDKLTGTAKEPELFDNFNRENETYVYVGEGSTKWGTEGINSPSNNLKVLSNSLGVLASSLNGVTKAKWGPNVKGWAELTELMGSSEGYVFFSARHAQSYAEIGGTWSGYGFIFIRTTTSTFVHQIRKYTGGSNAGTLASSTKALALNDQIGFSCEGSTHKLWRKPSGGEWEVLAEATDSSYNEAGYVGIEMTTATRLDNMWLGTIEAGKGITDTPTFTTGHSGSTYPRSVSETISTSEIPTRVTAVVRQSADTLSTIDTPSRVSPSSFARKVAEALSTLDSTGRVYVGARAISDVLSTSDQPFTGNFKERSVTETLTTSDAPSRSTGAHRSQTEAISTSESPKRAAGLHRSATDALSLSESPSRALVWLRATTETLTTSDAPTIAARVIPRFITETLATSDAVVRHFVGARALADTLSTSATPTHIGSVIRKVADTVTTSETPQRQTNVFRKPTETLSTSDANSVHKSFLKLISETLTTSDTNKHTLGHFARTIVETLSTADSVKRAYTGFRFVTDVVTGQDHPRVRIITIYHGDNYVQFRLSEPQYHVNGNERFTIKTVPAESTAYLESEDVVRLSCMSSEIRVNQPDPHLYLSEIQAPQTLATEYDDKLALDLSTK